MDPLRYWPRFADTQFNAKYWLRDFLGAGTFGGVFRADEVIRDRAVRQVAIKIFALDPARLDHQIAELQLATTLKHPHLLDCYSPEEGTLDGEAYLGLTMEVAHGTLSDRLAAGPLAEAEVRPLGQQLAAAIAFLHEKNITHRDLKPANILRVGEVWKIADLGIARLLTQSTATHTSPSQQIGTYAYMPPEAYRGEIRPAWDVWSLGILLHELLTGAHPFPGPTLPELMMQVLNHDPIYADTLPPDLRPLLDGCLAKDPQQRWPAPQVLAALTPHPVVPPVPSAPAGGDPPQPTATYPTVEFEVVTITGIEKSGFLGLGQPKVITQLARRQADFRREDLGQGVTLDLVRIPGGTFTMGSPESEEGRRKNEGPQHTVTVPEFWVGKYAVTQAQWRVVAALPQVAQKLDPDPSEFKGDQRPVEQVSWHDAMEFCARLSQHTGRPYRLPSEAEWEYACRAGTTTPFHFGPTITPDLANYHGDFTYGNAPIVVCRKQTTKVGRFPANGFGLYDMHGNVWEWCRDHRHANYQGAPVDGSAWTTGGNAGFRVLRGGSWYDPPRNCRSASRIGFTPGYRSNYIGFRVVCSAPGRS